MKTLLLKNKKGFILYIIGALLTPITGTLQSIAMAIGFGIYSATNQQEIQWRIILTLVIGLSPVLIQVLSRLLRISFMREVLTDVRVLVYQKIMKTPIEEFKQKNREDYVANLVNDINIFEQDFFLSILNITFSYGTFIIGEIILFYISPLIALMVLILSLTIYLFTKLYEKPIRVNTKKKQEANALYNQQVTNILGGLEVIKLYQVEDRFKPRFYNIVNQLERIKRKTNILQTTQSNLIEWIGETTQIGMLIFTAFLFTKGDILLEELIIVFSFVGQMIWANVNGANMINRLKGSLDIFNRMTQQSQWEKGTKPFTLNHQIDINNLCFSYDDHIVLDNLNITIPKGNKILIYGPTGTGKTTLLNCLSQNLTSYTGNILFDQHELKTIDFESFYKHCGYIRQQHFLFEDSIQNNIILDQELNEAKLIKILKDLDLYPWIESLSEGLNYQLYSNGNNISGGQRQRISIARELYRNCEVLFIDEPSASLDDETASKLYDTLFKLNQTIILVSHRHLNYLSERVDKLIQFDSTGGPHVL